MIREMLLAPGLRREHCDRLLAALARHEAEGIDRFLEGQRVEYLRTRRLLYEYEHRTGAFDAQWLQKNLGLRQPVVFPITTLSLLGRGAGRLAREKYGSAWASGKQSSGKAAEQWQHLMAMTAEDHTKEVDALNRVYAGILGLGGQTLLERSRACAARTLVEPLRNTYVAIFFEPDSGGIEAYLRTEALLGGTKCLIALRRWQLEHRELPPDLESLVKAAGMARVPNDPYCDQPLRMTAIQGEPVIYSVGKDGRDDKALSDWKNGTQPGDYIFRLVLPTN